MIFPGSFNSEDTKPHLSFAWIVVAVNVFIFIFANVGFKSWPKYSNYKEMQIKEFNISISSMYLQTLDSVEKRAIENFKTEKIATIAIKDRRFWSRVNQFPFQGDQVQIDRVKTVITDLKNQFDESIQYQYGLSSHYTSPWAWITYQFTHHSFLHLLSNLIFLFMVISYLQKQIEPSWIAAIYVLGGIGGGIGFLFLNTEGDLAMIGASGSVCALLSFLAVYKKNQTMIWNYFFAPIPKGYGEIYLPAFLILPIYLMSDFTAVLWTPSGVAASVAHSAHIGGAFMGLLLGLMFHLDVFIRSKATSHGVLRDHNRFNELL